MTKEELIGAIMEIAPGEHETPGKRIYGTDAEAVLKSLGKIVATELAFGGTVPLPGIGILEVKKRKARQGRNPRTGEAMTIPAHKVVRLRVAGSLKNAVNQ